ncbi:MAG: intradiol ring-cleavage dioxygenase [Burkholderiaceae bacterium]|nr:intradiol ring-cleavage dioxygenase [Burkholderiaceae bacterium]
MRPTRSLAPSAQLHRRRRALVAWSAGIAALVGAPQLWLPSRLAAAQPAGARPLRLTPAQTEGPFYPPELPADHDADLLRVGRMAGADYGRAPPAWVEGTLSDAEGRVVKGAAVEIWQCDADGRYHHPGDHGGRADPAFQGFGRVSVDADTGRWRFRTIRPVPYPGRTPHIHLKVRLARRELLTTQLYVQGDPGNERDFLWRRLSADDRAAITRPFEPTGAADGSLRAHYALVVAA